jgi:hypothetical protein
MQQTTLLVTSSQSDTAKLALQAAFRTSTALSAAPSGQRHSQAALSTSSILTAEHSDSSDDDAPTGGAL